MDRGALRNSKRGGAVMALPILAIILLPISLSAQRVNNIAVGTNLIGWSNLITINAEFSYPVTRNYTAHLKLKINPWTFNKGDVSQLQSRQFSVAAGVRRWSWYANAGWFYGGGLQYSLFNQGGLSSRRTREGWALGLNLQAGYALVLSKHLNLEFGAGLFGSFAKYTIYSCQKCGRVTGSGAHFGVVPDNILLQLVYII